MAGPSGQRRASQCQTLRTLMRSEQCNCRGSEPRQETPRLQSPEEGDCSQ